MRHSQLRFLWKYRRNAIAICIFHKTINRLSHTLFSFVYSEPSFSPIHLLFTRSLYYTRNTWWIWMNRIVLKQRLHYTNWNTVCWFNRIQYIFLQCNALATLYVLRSVPTIIRPTYIVIHHPSKPFLLNNFPSNVMTKRKMLKDKTCLKRTACIIIIRLDSLK